MHAVVSLLDPIHTARVAAAWSRLRTEAGVQALAETVSLAYVSYQVADEYDLPKLLPLLQAFAARQQPFRVGTAGLGIRTGPHPALYVPVVRTALLSALHQDLWQALTPGAVGVQGYGRPDAWLPQIALPAHELTGENVGAVLRPLLPLDFLWDVPVDNFALIHAEGGLQEVRQRFPFGG